MRFRSCYIPTLKETPADAEVISHKLLVRAGLIRKITSGVYTYMPLALRALRKIETLCVGFCHSHAGDTELRSAGDITVVNQRIDDFLCVGNWNRETQPLDTC